MGGIPAHGIIEEFKQAAEEVRADPAKIPIWQPIIGKYHPTLIGECQKAIKWSNDMVEEWLTTGIFAGLSNPAARAKKVMKELSDHALTLSHARHIDLEKAEAIGLEIVPLEEDDDLQDAILTVHHLCIQTIGDTAVIKLIENHEGVTFAQSVAMQQVAP
jgi:hypothetical protein